MSSASCWPVWGDNHYTVSQVPSDYWSTVRRRYDDAGVGYMLFQQLGDIFTGYFPLPGGMYIELQPSWNDGGHIGGLQGVSSWMPSYCYPFSCPS